MCNPVTTSTATAQSTGQSDSKGLYADHEIREADDAMTWWVQLPTPTEPPVRARTAFANVLVCSAFADPALAGQVCDAAHLLGLPPAHHSWRGENHVALRVPCQHMSHVRESKCEGLRSQC